MSPLLQYDGAPHGEAPLGLLLAAQVERAPDATALTFPDETVTRKELERRTNMRARQLIRAGLKPNGIVMIALPNCREFYEVTIATWKAGGTPLHISAKLKPREYDELFSLAQPQLVVDAKSPLLISPDDFDGSPVDATPAKHWKISTSGGSTGRPKLIVDARPALWSAEKEAVRRKPDAVIINPGPLYHSAPFAIMHTALLEGCHVIEMGRFDAERYLALSAQHSATWAYLVPTMMQRIAKLPREIIDRNDLSSVETVLHMAAVCPPHVKRFWIDWLGPDRIWEVYGGTERIGATTIGGSEWLEHPGSVGKARAGIEARILNEAGDEVPRGAIGEMFFKREGGASSTFSYVGADVRQRGDWASFGDMGWMDEDGYLYIADRRTDMIVSGGVNIYPAEIEAQIDALPGVVSSVVVGAPHTDLGEVPCAVVHRTDDANDINERVLIESISNKLAAVKLPKHVIFVSETIRSDAGKIRRMEWREWARKKLEGAET